QALEAVLLPEVHDLGPAPGGADRAPHAVAELVALRLGDRRPVGGHVVHVVGPVVPDDVDELVDVHLAVRHAYSLHHDHDGPPGGRRSAPSVRWTARPLWLTSGSRRRRRRSAPRSSPGSNGSTPTPSPPTPTPST